MNKILVLGACGQLGRKIIDISKNYPEFEFIFKSYPELDITDFEKLENQVKELSPKYIINCAAYTAVDKAEEEKELAYLINGKCPEYISKLALKYKAELIHISTDYVFDGTNHTPYKENDITNPNSVYGASKLDGENKVLAQNNTVIIRTSWLYSEHGSNFLKTMIRLGKERDELGVIFDQIGTPTYAGDLAEAILNIIQKSKTKDLPYGIYHFSNEGVCSWYDFAKEIHEISRIKCHVKPIETKDYPTPAKRPHYSVLNKHKIKSTFNIEIPYWKDSLKECLNKISE